MLQGYSSHLSHLRPSAGRIPKALEKLHRPALHIACAWVLGCCIEFFIADEDLPKDPQTQMEMLVPSDWARLCVSELCTEFTLGRGPRGREMSGTNVRQVRSSVCNEVHYSCRQGRPNLR